LLNNLIYVIIYGDVTHYYLQIIVFLLKKGVYFKVKIWKTSESLLKICMSVINYNYLIQYYSSTKCAFLFTA